MASSKNFRSIMDMRRCDRAFVYAILIIVAVMSISAHARVQALSTQKADCAECPPMVPVPGLAKKSVLYVARHEITWREYMAAVRQAQCPMPKITDTERYAASDERLADNYPVTSLPVREFDCYLSWLSRRTGKRYRLPTPVEWEHLARAGTRTNYPWGDSLGYDNAAVGGHYDERRRARAGHTEDSRSAIRSGIVLPVENFPPNAWGLFDVIGNAREVTTKTVDGPALCRSKLSAEWCRLIAVRGAGDGWLRKTVQTISDEELWFSGATYSALGFRPVHD